MAKTQDQDQDTKDEQSHAHLDSAASPVVDGVPVVEFAYHADLRRIGDRTPGAAFTARGGPIVLGRAGPAFEPTNGGTGAPWEDPCISRGQLSVAWDARHRVFHVGAIEGARRALDAFDGPLPVGSRLGLEDRATLLFTRRRVAPGMDRLDFVGESDAMWAVRDALVRLALSDKPVLITGETGTGKELAARALHKCSGRPEDRFRALNCAALPASLIESELFGHERGAFTGADREKKGLVGEAHGGTLFLDEIGDLPLETQTKLLRFLGDGKYRRVGGSDELLADVKIVAATHRDLRQMVAARAFGADLYYRLAPPGLTMPPLRERLEDLPSLVVACLRDAERRGLFTFEPASTRAPRIGRDFFEALMRHPWPGNVRELRGIVERMVLLGPAAALAALDAGPMPPQGPVPPARARREVPPTEAEIHKALDDADFVKAKAATALRVARNTLDKHMRAFGIRSPMDVTDAELSDSVARNGKDLEAIARELRISVRGLKLRLLRKPPETPPTPPRKTPDETD